MQEGKKSILELIAENKARIIFISAAMSLLILSTTALFFFTNIIRISDEENTVVLLSTFSDKDKLLEMADMDYDRRQDQILYTSYDGNYKSLAISHSFTVPITVDGTQTEVQISQGTVADCLAKAEIVLGEHDYTQPSLHTQIQNGDSIRVYRVEYLDNQYEEEVPFGVEYKYSSLTYRFKNRQYTLREGSVGKNLVTYRERYVDGELELALVSKVEVITKPVDKLVLAYGKTAVSPLSAPDGVSVVNGVPTGYSRVLTNMSSTGYYSSSGSGASGLGLFYGSVAVNPNVIPYGTKMYIASPDGQFIYGWAIATDTGGALMNGSVGVDLFYETYLESTLNWRNTVNIYIYD